MKTSQYGFELVKQFEGLRLKAYKCPAGVWTIGYGHTSSAGVPTVTPGMVISKENAEEILKRDMVQYEDGVRKLVTIGITQGQFDALVSFAYNVGVWRLGQSTLLKKVNAGNFDNVPAEFMKWTRGGGKELAGLVRRRRAEVKLWRGMDTSKPIHHDESRTDPDQPKASKSIMQSKEANGAVIAGSAGAIAVVQEVMPIIKDGGDILSGMSGTAIVCLVVVVAAIAVWWFRKQKLDEEGA